MFLGLFQIKSRQEVLKLFTEPSFIFMFRSNLETYLKKVAGRFSL